MPPRTTSSCSLALGEALIVRNEMLQITGRLAIDADDLVSRKPGRFSRAIRAGLRPRQVETRLEKS